MNKLIEELAEKAYNDSGQGTPDQLSSFMQIFCVKFADRIMQECVNQCRQEWYDTNNDPELNAETDPRMIGIKIGVKQGALRCISRIKKYYGVEE